MRRTVTLSLGLMCLTLASSACMGNNDNSAEPAPPPNTVTVSPSATVDAPRQSPTTSTPDPTDDNWKADTFSNVKTGVVRLQVGGCDKGWLGTGFLVGTDEIITAAHVARDAASISVKGPSGITRADVVDYQMSSDTALLRMRQPLEGFHFDIASQNPGPGTGIIVLGYPFGVNDLRLSDGLISSEDTDVTYDGDDGFTVDDVIVTNAATNGGNSGGPAIDRHGQVVGLVSGGQNWTDSTEDAVPAQGTNYLVPASVIAKRYEEWAKEPSDKDVNCDSDGAAQVDDDHELEVSILSDQPAADDIAQALFLYGDSINQGLYDTAWSVLTSKMQEQMGDFEQWADAKSTSYWDSLTVKDVAPYNDGQRALAVVQFRTRQDAEYGYDGQTCSDWQADYQVQRIEGAWYIDAVSRSANPTAC